MTDVFGSSYANMLGNINGMFDRRAQRQAGRAIAGGNYQAGADALLQNGDLQSGLAIQNAGRERQQADAARQWDFTVKATNALEGVLAQGGDVVAAYDSLAPVFQQMGTTPEQIQALRQSLAANPAQFLQSIKATVPVEYQFRDGGAGDVVRVDPRTGRAEIAYDAPDRPIATQFGIILPPGARGDAVPTPAGTQPMTGPSAISSNPLWEGQPPASASPAGGYSRGERNNNPGNIEDGPYAQSLPGYVGSDGRFAIFSTPEAGNQAKTQLLSSYIRRGFDTPAEIINRWAPPSDNNPTQAYAAYVARRAGIGVNDQVTPEKIPLIAQAIQEFETGNRPSSGGAINAPVEQGDAGLPQDGTQDLGGGYRLQPMETPADRRAAAQQAVQMARWAVEDSRTARQEEREDTRDARTVQGQTFTQENQLRSQFGQNQAVKDMGAVQAQVGIIGNIARRAAAGEDISAQDDLALIFAYMKMLDPGSVVREGEFANAQNTAGIPERIVNAYNNARQGTRLSDNQRAEFFQSATGVMNSYRQAYDTQVERTRTLAESYGLDPNRVAPRRGGSGGGAQGLVSAPGLRFQITPGQSAIRERITSSGGSPRARLGGRQNPYYVNPSDARGSYANVPSGAFFVTPDGEIRGPKP